MRQLFVLIVLAAAGYVGYNYYQEHYKPAAPEPAVEAAPAEPPPMQTAPPTPAPPAFKSRIPGADAPGEKRTAPPGIYYMVERVSAETKNGIIAVVPGDEVKLLKRDGNTLKVTIGAADFEVKETQVTNDLDRAREVERQEFLKRGGRQ